MLRIIGVMDKKRVISIITKVAKAIVVVKCGKTLLKHGDRLKIFKYHQFQKEHALQSI